MSLENMMLGLAIGDALGAGYQFAFKERHLYSEIDISCYSTNPNVRFLNVPGKYTDGTQMSVAVAELLLSNKDFNHLNLAESFVQAFKRDPIDSYARGFQSFLESVSSGKEFLEKIKPYSERNGAAMRSVPLGVLENEEDVVNCALINASLTHNTSKGLASSVVVALLSHYAIFHKRMPSFKELKSYVGNICPLTANYLSNIDNSFDYSSRLILGDDVFKGVPCDAMKTVGAVWAVLKKFDKPSKVVGESLFLGGDTDDTVSLALGINLINNSLDDLPPRLVSDLDNHAYGKDYLIGIGKDLERKFLTN